MSTFDDAVVMDPDFNAGNNWQDKFLKDSNNYALCQSINADLAKLYPGDNARRIDPIYLRVWAPGLVCVLDNDVGPNGVKKLPGTPDYMGYLRQDWNDLPVVHHGLSGRVDRNALFLRPLRSFLANENSAKVAKVSIVFQIRFDPSVDVPVPSHETSIDILDVSETVLWKMKFDEELAKSMNTKKDLREWYIEIDARTPGKVPDAVLDTPLGLSTWRSVRVQQSVKAASTPWKVGMHMKITRKEFDFPVERLKIDGSKLAFPPGESPQPGDDSVKWPEEVFEYVTGGDFMKLAVSSSSSTTASWQAPLGFWTNPKQPIPKSVKNVGVPDFLLQGFDPLLDDKPTHKHTLTP